MKKLAVGCLILLSSYAFAEIQTTNEEPGETLDDELQMAVDYLYKKVDWLIGRALKDRETLNELTAELPESISVSCGPNITNLDTAAPDPEWQSADAPQRAHDAGFRTIYIVSSDDPCGPVEITRDGVWIWDPAVEQTFERISVRGADNVLLTDIYINELEIVSSSVTVGDITMEHGGLIMNSLLHLQPFNSVENLTIIGSTITTRGTVLWNGDTEVINSQILVELGENNIYGRLILRGSSYVKVSEVGYPNEPGGFGLSSGGQIICDPQTSRLFSTNPVSFQPPQTGSETCLISEPYE